jgi:3-oxo-5-alpha-steroid 4-dehydrogenase 1
VTERALFNGLLLAMFVLAGLVFVALFFMEAPYGRYARHGWGLGLGRRMAWLVMESASPIVFAVCFWSGGHRYTPAMLIFLLMWEAHYIHRAFIYPFSLRGTGGKMPVLIIAFGLLFNTANAYLNGRNLFHFAPEYGSEWLRDPRFIAGAALFVIGFVLNRWADRALRGLRRPGESGYRVPGRGLYKLVSCPNYLGEIITWTGWAVATWSLPGLAFAVWTVANLAPRARSHHAWYRQRFPDYPPQRKALLPGLW